MTSTMSGTQPRARSVRSGSSFVSTRFSASLESWSKDTEKNAFGTERRTLRLRSMKRISCRGYRSP